MAESNQALDDVEPWHWKREQLDSDWEDSSTEGRESLFDYFEFASCSLTMRCLDWNRGGKRRHENIGDVWWENGELWSPGLLVQDIVDDSEKYLDVV